MRQWYKIQHPEIFQGELRNKHYFEGWYLKNVGSDGKCIYAFIPGVALNQKTGDSHAFIQIFNGLTQGAHYFRFPISEFHPSKEKFEITLANSKFSLKGIFLDIDQGGQKIQCQIQFTNTTPWPKPHFGYGIMGPFAFVPLMECRHGLVSMTHDLSGTIVHNGQTYDLRSGKGYIEKDYGRSFPNGYIWMQSNHFKTDHHASFFLSVARIPSFRMHFTGFICAFLANNQYYAFTTYTHAHITSLKIEEKKFVGIIENKLFQIEISADKGAVVSLPSPQSGNMTGRIQESLTSTISVKLWDKKQGNTLIFDDIGQFGGLEIMATQSQLKL